MIFSLNDLDKKLFFEIPLASKENHTSVFYFVPFQSKYFSGEIIAYVFKDLGNSG